MCCLCGVCVCVFVISYPCLGGEGSGEGGKKSMCVCLVCVYSLGKVSWGVGGGDGMEGRTRGVIK